ncbi:hypothetical protein QBC38DRAFT_488901 [Podospora fimiseda]|uniref:Uncharacterized protein n=1 Tax=Podospora fimiseda TaxID=252190 RepID=A0AAN7BFX7_9PEZI|nr:hypothetical protein QBC38DRAFT_488901 [Podospora fimiseda]
MGRPCYSDHYDWYECNWCRQRPSWNRRPCLLALDRVPGLLHSNREWWNSVRMENAAARNKTLPKIYRRAMRVAAAAAAAEAKDDDVLSNSSICGNADDTEEMETETDKNMGTETAVEKKASSTRPTSTESKKDHEPPKKESQKRQSKAITAIKSMIDEGVNLAFDHDGNDIAIIHAANRKAWPRGQEPIAANATVEDRDIAELVQMGLIGIEGLGVNHDDFGDEVCQYTVRLVVKKKKGRRNRQRREAGAESESSDRSYLHDGKCEEEPDFRDGSELSFVYVD